MSEPFLSEIKIVSFNFPPKGWALCNGQFLPINQNQALFALLGTTYVTINIQQMPTHTHPLMASSTSGNQLSPAGHLLGNVQAKIYNDPVQLTTLSPDSVSSVGGSQPHNNMMPYLVL